MTKFVDIIENGTKSEDVHKENKKHSRRSVSLHRNEEVKSSNDCRDERSNRRYLMRLVIYIYFYLRKKLRKFISFNKYAFLFFHR